MGSRAGQVRKLTARSAILSALLGAHPPEVPVSGIVRVATGLGVQESAARAALTRMVAAGDLERTDAVYRLSARLLDRQRRQDDAVAPHHKPWDGCWRLAVVTVGADDATDRAAFRNTLQRMKFGELREGVWTRPDNLVLTPPRDARRRLTFFTAQPDEPSPDLAHRLFEPRMWSARAQALLGAFHDSDAITGRFEIAAAIVRHILDDPVLPPPLLPTDWPGGQLRAAYANFRVEFAEFATSLIDT